MPIFEYTCKNCSFRFESLTLGTKKTVLKCPSCGSEDVAPEKVHKFGISFKGTGFPGNDMKNGKKGKP